MKIEIKRFILTSLAHEKEPVVFDLEGFDEVDRRMLWALFSPILRGKSLKIEDFAMLLTIEKLSSPERATISGLKDLMAHFAYDSNTICSVTCEWEDLG